MVSSPRAVAEVKRGDLNDTGIIRVKGLKPELDFDVFTVQRSPLDSSGVLAPPPFEGFGLAWYQSDLHSDHHGNAQVVIKTILLDQIFGFDADAVPTLDTHHAADDRPETDQHVPSGFLVQQSELTRRLVDLMPQQTDAVQR